MATNLIEEFGPTLKLAHDYIKNSQVHIQHAFSSIWFNVRFIYSTDDKAIYYERFVTTALEIWMTGTATHLKVHGHSLLPIMVGLYQIALQKDWRWVRSSEIPIRKYFISLNFFPFEIYIFLYSFSISSFSLLPNYMGIFSSHLWWGLVLFLVIYVPALLRV